MDQDLCKLTLVYPSMAEDQILDVFLDSRPELRGFTSLHAEGHGMGFEQTTARERVRGRIERRMLIVVLGRERLKALLEELRERAAMPNLTFWVEPVEQFGQFV